MFLQVRQKWRIMDKLDFPGVVLTRTAEVLIVHSQQLLTVLSSAVVGGGWCAWLLS